MDRGFLPEKLQDLCLRPEVAWLIVLANIAGTLFGFYYYLPQFSRNSFFLWPLIADSPIATLSLAFSLTFYLKDRKNRFLDLFAFVANVKYGLWTVFVLLNYPVFLSQNTLPMYLFLLTSHFLMFLQASLVLEYADFSLEAVVPIGAWFILNDLADYTLDIHPCISASCDHSSLAAMVAAGFLTAATLASVYVYSKNLKVNQ